MADQFTDVTTTGYCGRIINSIKGVVIGLILFVVSFGLLYWNEGRVDLSNIAKTATEISSATVSTYSKGWEENPKSTSNFKHPEGHENPQKSLDSYTNKVTAATIGAYNFDPQSVTLPNFSQLPLNSQNVTLSDGATLANDSYIFIKKSEGGTFDSPQVGDLRISYHVLRPGFDGTIFGKLSGSKIDPYFDQDGNNLYRLFIGTRDQAISTLHTEYTTLLWILRLVG